MALEQVGKVEQAGQTGVEIYRDDPRWSLVERILATPDFERSPRLSDFLRHICQLTLEGKQDSISEQYLGEVLFGRPPEYDSSADTIVRSHALRLRRRLEQYFQRAGRNETMRLVIPRGAYVPQFVPVAESEEPSSEPIPAEPTAEESEAQLPEIDVITEMAERDAASRRIIGRYRILMAAALTLTVALAIVAIVLGVNLHLAHIQAHTADRKHPLWGRLFSSEEPTRIVLGDSGLVLFHATAHRYVTLQQYVNNDLSQQMPFVKHVDPWFAQFLAGRRYTSIVDATAAVGLLRLPEATPDRTLVSFSRDMRLDDFKSGNIIMIGAQEANPWLELFEHSMDFVFSIDTPNQITAFRNRHPQAGEQEIYSSPASGPQQLYAVIAFLPNLNTNDNVLLLEGITMAGTEAAVDLVLDDQRLRPILDKIRRPDGTLPHFEMLISCDMVKDSPAPAQVVSIHIHP